MDENQNTNTNVSTPEETKGYFVGVRFRGGDKSYYFSTTFDDFKAGDLVVVETISGYEMGKISIPSTPLAAYHSNLELKPILRKPTKSDMTNYNFNLSQEKQALEICREQIESLGLPMDLIDAVYTLDGSKVTITYTSTEKRVDFRELLHMLVPALSCRVELRQIASRDKAKMIGGIGICGLPLCCSTFLSNFEGISIQRAKNQMLTLNIPKLSGPCGKLICCLLYEDDAYTEAKKEFPTHGTVIHTPDGDYTVDSFNVLSKNVRLVNATRDDYKTYPLEDIRAMQKGTYKKKEERLFEDIPNFNINVTDASYGGMHPDSQDHTTYSSVESNADNGNTNKPNRGNNHHHGNRGNGRNPQNGNRQDSQRNRQNNGNNQNNRANPSQNNGNQRHFNNHHHRPHGNGQRNNGDAGKAE